MPPIKRKVVLNEIQHMPEDIPIKSILPDSNRETVHFKIIKHLRKNHLLSLNLKTRYQNGFYYSVDCAGRLSNQLGLHG